MFVPTPLFICRFSPLNCLLHAKPGCSSEFSGIEFGEAQLVQIKVHVVAMSLFVFVLLCIFFVIFYFSLLFPVSIGVNFELCTCYEL